MFGSTEVDLRNASPAPGAELDVFVALGGVGLKVPEGWNVRTRGMPIFGGFENITAREKVPPNADVRTGPFASWPSFRSSRALGRPVCVL